MKRIRSLVVEIQNIARERGHDPASVTYRGRSNIKLGEHALVSCETCGMLATANTKPPPNDIDIGGELIAVSCNVATPNLIQGATLDELFSPRACANLIP